MSRVDQLEWASDGDLIEQLNTATLEYSVDLVLYDNWAQQAQTIQVAQTMVLVYIASV